MKRQRKILNILYGKYTFDQLSNKEKDSVDSVCFFRLLQGCHDKEYAINWWNGFDDLQKYGFRALAMSELDIPPADGEYKWSFVKNPIIVSSKIRNSINIDLAIFNKKHKSKLEFN
jgi:hypothetical protein